MRINFEVEHDFGFRILNLICALRGHQWKKYVAKQKLGYDWLFTTAKPVKQCDRCGDVRYTKVASKPMTIKFATPSKWKLTPRRKRKKKGGGK